MSFFQTIGSVVNYIKDTITNVVSAGKDVGSKQLESVQKLLKELEHDPETPLKKRKRTLKALDVLRRKTDLSLAARRVDFYQILATKASFAKWETGDVLDSPGEGIGEYKVGNIITNNRGLRIVIFEPTVQGEPPIFSCRGTAGNVQNVIDDLGKNIAKYGFSPSEEEIHNRLVEMAITHNSPVVVTGYSLGGALAQTINTMFCDLLIQGKQSIIKEVLHFNSPGVGKLADLYESKRQQLIDDNSIPPHVESYAHIDDAIAIVGGKHILADVGFEVGKHSSSKNFFTRFKNAHCKMKPISEYKDEMRPVTTPSPARKILKKTAETIRASAPIRLLRTALKTTME